MTFFIPADPDDEAYQKNLRRPAEVKEDLRQMSDRSRVSLILNSEAFRRELEEIVDESLRQGNAPASLLALQQISNLLMPNARFPHGPINAGGRQLGLNHRLGRPPWTNLVLIKWLVMFKSHHVIYYLLPNFYRQVSF